MIRALRLIIATAYSATAQTGFEPELLGRVRQHIAANVSGLPDYTCQETMERSMRAPTGRMVFRERLRLEVLGTKAGEIFSWPGSAQFAREPLESWIAAGAIENGNFLTDLRNLFQLSSATTKYAGTETIARQAVHRFDFHAPLLSSRYTLTIDGKTAITAYSGSFWVSQESLDIVRLEMRAEEIPPDLDCRQAQHSVTYGRTRLGVSEWLIPSAAELLMVSREGRESRNSVAFSRCRHYATETSLSFDTAAAVESPARSSPQPNLPAGVALNLRLEHPISIRESAAGDPIVARLDKPVTAGGLSLPKGTRVLGRIRRLEQYLSSPASIRIGLEFFAMEATGGRIPFTAFLTGPRATTYVDRANYGSPAIVMTGEGLNIEDDGMTTGIGSFRIDGKELHIPRGFRTFWKTRQATGTAQQD